LIEAAARGALHHPERGLTLRRLPATLLVLALCTIALIALADLPQPAAESKSLPAHHVKGGFRNLDPGYSFSMLGRTVRLFRRSFEGWPDRGRPLSTLRNDGVELRANGTAPTLTWIGHSTFLIQLDGINILTDPIWSDRASPLSFAGPRRLVPPGMRLADLPAIHAVIISHDHYDHLDVDTVRRLARTHAPRFFVPLGLKAWLGDQGIADVVELDWWERATLGPVAFVATPAQHSSGRGLHDQNRRLWCGWALLGATKRLYFAGDTGYFAGGRQIGERLGPFAVAAIPIGGYIAYERRHPNHLNPEEAVQLFEDVGAELMVPMHWGTFDMNREPFREPPDRLLREALGRGLEGRVALLTQGESIHW
jgi:N-acyl-phosphatidylethanolamine-hydrolysing phospholipase D